MSEPHKKIFKRSAAVRAKMSAARKAALADPEVRAKMSAASKAAWAKNIPPWVPESLVAEYRDLSKEFGEEHAASVVRRLKREMMVVAA